MTAKTEDLRDGGSLYLEKSYPFKLSLPMLYGDAVWLSFSQG